MKVQPKSDKEIAEMDLWPEGTYGFEIIEAHDTVSKTSGNEMISLKVSIFNDAGSHRFLFDYLLESMPKKLKHCAAVCGVLDKYEAGYISAIDFAGKTGSAKIKIQPEKDGFAAKNVISDYVTPEGYVSSKDKAKAAPKVEQKPELVDDDIPF